MQQSRGLIGVIKAIVIHLCIFLKVSSFNFYNHLRYINRATGHSCFVSAPRKRRSRNREVGMARKTITLVHNARALSAAKEQY